MAIKNDVNRLFSCDAVSNFRIAIQILDTTNCLTICCGDSQIFSGKDRLPGRRRRANGVLTYSTRGRKSLPA